MEENNVHITEVQEDIVIEETIDVIEVSSVEDYEIDLDEALEEPIYNLSHSQNTLYNNVI